MLRNVSYNDPKLQATIDAAVGAPYPLMERFKRKGIGSSKLIVKQASKEIHSLYALDHNNNSCNIEMRPQGIIIRFRSLLETYALVIPYYKLQLYKGEAEAYTVYMDHHFLRIKARAEADHRFFRKILAEKAAQTPPSLEDL
ncbi:MAG: hypothetical protein ACPGC5_01050 [Flavobacteriaceae bacterium]